MQTLENDPELTFAPKINPTSQVLAERRRREDAELLAGHSGQAQLHVTNKIRRRARAVQAAESTQRACTFAPTINPTSELLAMESEDYQATRGTG